MNVASAVSFVWDTKPDFPSKTSLYYSGLLFGKVFPQVFYCETSFFHWFSQVIISCLIYFFPLHDFDMILMFVYFNKFYS